MKSAPARGLVCAVLACQVTACRSGAEAGNDELPTWSVAAEPTVTIGGSDDRPDYIVFRPVHASRLSDGRIAVVASGSSDVRYYDSSGAYIRTTGRQGRGPGEFTGILAARRLAADSLLILSLSPGLTWIGPDGVVARTQPFDLRSAGAVPCRIGEGNWYPADGAHLVLMLEENRGIRGCPDRVEGVHRSSVLAAVRHMTDGILDTLALLPGTERNGRQYRVFGTSTIPALGEGRVYVTDTGSDTILGMSLAGDTLSVLTSPFEPHPVPVEARAADARRFERNGEEVIGEAYDYPGTYPRVARMLVDRLGLLWVMAYPTLTDPTSSWQLEKAFAGLVGGDGGEWRVLDVDGTVVAEVRTPPGLFPLEIGADYVLGLTRDEYDVPAVQLHALVRSPAPA